MGSDRAYKSLGGGDRKETAMERQMKPTLAEGAKARLFEHLLRRLDDAARAQELSKQALRMVRTVMDDPFSAEVAAATERVRKASARVDEITRELDRVRDGVPTRILDSREHRGSFFTPTRRSAD